MKRILLILILLWPCVAEGAATVRQFRQYTAGSGASHSVTINATAAGSTIVVGFGFNPSTTTAMSDSASQTWTQDITSTLNTQRCEIWHVSNSSSITSVTLTLGVSKAVSIWVAEIVGVPSSPTIVTAQSTGTSTTPSPGNVSTPADGICIGVTASNGAGIPSSASTFSLGYSTSTNKTFAAEFIVANSTGNQAASFTNGSGDWAAAAISISPSASGASGVSRARVVNSQ
jgi:hypothetical protein